MRRPLSICALMLSTVAIVPATLFAQTPPPAAQPAGPPKLGFSTPAGLLLIQIKPDQTAVFEEMVGKIRAGVAKSTDEALKKQLSTWKMYKASEPMGAEKNALYVVVTDPALGADAEYEFFAILTKVMTPEELRSEETQALFKKYSGAFAAPYNKLNLTPVGGQ